MKAVVYTAHGGPENISITTLDDPTPAPGDVLVRVRAVALNGFDPMILKGIPGLKTPMPHIPGGDIAGEVAGFGAGVEGGRWKRGDRVLVNPYVIGRGMMGETARGGACELVSVPATHLVPIPDNVSFTDAAALPVAYGTAMRMMITRGRVARGESVLVLGASGGVGTCCIQLAKLRGCRAIGVTSSAEKAARLLAIGADEVINAGEGDWAKQAVERFGKPRVHGESGGVDVIVNYVGGEDWTKAYRALKRGGRMLTCGATNGYAPPEDIRYLWSFEYELIGSNGWSQEDLGTLLAMASDGRMKPVIDSIRPLDDFLTSYAALADRKVFGKAVLTV
ncbi:MAG: zinc-binding dehydrogenase [Alphaproteobacteria bacterium]|nr:zinc-binding dehydrogenase [Alphaproteobacteria bacterium]